MKVRAVDKKWSSEKGASYPLQQKSGAPKLSIEKYALFQCTNYVHIEAMKYGYARYRPTARPPGRTCAQLTKAGCKEVFRETASRAKTDRRAPMRCAQSHQNK